MNYYAQIHYYLFYRISFINFQMIKNIMNYLFILNGLNKYILQIL
jgi:hypothetical protein